MVAKIGKRQSSHIENRMRNPDPFLSETFRRIRNLVDSYPYPFNF
jgi:hypothetical protein